jgi:spoIIIJ-associated protein
MSPRRRARGTGKSVEEAIAQALAELGVGRDDAEIEIVREGSRGILGFGAEEAVVVASVELPASSAVPPTEIEVVEEAPKAPERAPRAEEEAAAAAAPSEQKVAQVAKEVLETLLEKMGMPASVSVVEGGPLSEDGEPAPTLLDVTGSDLGILIGRRGETLRDLQFMTRLIVNRRLGYWPNLVVDVEGYKARRKEMLTGLALRMAEKAAETLQPVILEPMSAYERRIIHIALRDHPQVMTESTGEGDSRKVMIIPTK